MSHLLQELLPVCIGCLTVVLVVLVMRKTKPSTPVAEHGYLRVAGRLVSLAEWSPEVLDEIVAKHFGKPVTTTGLMIIADVTATCPLAHGTTEPVAVISTNADLVTALSDRLVQTRAVIRCTTCGKPAKLTAKIARWQGKCSDWDGAL